jgi:filamentous hemagglutinin family protein
MLLFDSLYKSRYIVGLLGWLTVGSVAWTQPVVAQVTPDATLGAESSTVTSTTVNGVSSELINGGASRGQNLFHSFLNFSIQAGRGAYFSNPNGILNILSRVTGNNSSNINGTLGVLGNANLFFLNPNGIIFGPNASLSVNGSFLATTASTLQFGNQGTFSAINPTPPGILTINPSALLFNQIAAQPIHSQATLRVPDNRSLLLVGGPIRVDGGELSALGGRVELASLASPGSVGLNVTGDRVNLEFPSTAARSNITLNDAFINVDASTSGHIGVYGQVLDASNTFLSSRTTSGNGGAILLDIADAIVLRNNSLVQTGTSGSGTGGDVTANTRQLTVQDGSGIATFTGTSASGRGGNLTINAFDSVTITGAGESSSDLSTISFGPGDGGTLTINTKQLVVQDQGQVASSTLGTGAGGKLTINATDFVLVTAALDEEQIAIGAIFTATFGSGNAENLVINTKQLALRNGATIFSRTFDSGNAGNILINASESVILSDPITDASGFESSSFIASGTSGSGNGGSVTINTGQLALLDGASISTTTLGEEDAGDLIINATESVTLSGTNTTQDGEFPSDLSAAGLGNGNAGNISIDTSLLTLIDGASISAFTSGKGNGGSIIINASESVALSGAVDISSGTLSSSISSFTLGSGNAGNIEITTGQLTLQDGASITTSALMGEDEESGGNGGNLTINASDSIVLSGTAPEGGGSFLSTTETDGDAGEMVINTGQLTVQGESLITTLTNGSGDAGDLSINASEFVTIGSDATGGTPGFLSTSTFSSGNAGNLTINTKQLTVQSGSIVTTFTDGSGLGGNLTINVSDSVIVSGASKDGLSSSLSTSTFSGGDAGNLIINTGELTVQNGAFSETSTFGDGKGGNLTINASDSVTVGGTSVDGDISFLSAGTFSSGDAGDLTINTKVLLVENQAELFSSTLSSGDGGNITINASESVVLKGTADGQFGTGLFSTSQGEATGNAGNITILTRNLIIENRALISAVTQTEGKGGDINISATDSAVLKGNGTPLGEGVPTGLFAASFGKSLAGTITLSTGNLSISNKASISVQSVSAGDAGEIQLFAEKMNLDGGSILASADQSGGGNIEISAQAITLTNNSLISTNVFDSTGGGGDIAITTDTFIALENSDILATADEGPGGNITITASTFLADVFANDGPTPSSEADFQTLRNNGRVDISASSAESVSGQVNIPDLNLLQKALDDANVSFIRADQIVASSCLTKGTRRGNKFTVSGTGGIAQIPYKAIQMDFHAEEVGSVQTSSSQAQQLEQDKLEQANVSQVWRLGDPIQEATGILITADGQLRLDSKAPISSLKESQELICR